MCIKINNLYFAQCELDEFVCKYYTNNDCQFTDTFIYLKKKLNHLIQMTICWV